MISLGEYVSNCNALISALSGELEDGNLSGALECARELSKQVKAVVSLIEDKIEYREERESKNE